VPLAAQAGDVVVEGFTDIIFTVTDESADNSPSTPTPSGDNTAEKKFTADAEVDFIVSPTDGVTARVDIDFDLATNDRTNVNGDNADSGRIEQAFFAWNINEGPLTLIGGVFNNPLGQDEEDAPNINFTTHTAIFNILDNQTALYGNNVTGVALAAGAGMFTGTIAFLNDIGQVDEENSLALVLTAMPMPDMEFEFGYVTQDNDTTAAGNVWDLNGAWNNIAGSGAQAGFDYLGTDEILDGVYNVWAGFEFGSGFAVRARYELAAFDVVNAPDDSTAVTLYGSWQARSNLLIALQYTAGESDGTALDGLTGIFDGDLVTVEFIATLP